MVAIDFGIIYKGFLLGYAYLGYAALITLFIPFTLAMLKVGPFGKGEK